MTPEQKLELELKVAEPQFAGPPRMPEDRVAEILNTPDPQLPPVLTKITGRELAEVPAWTGELGLLRIVAKTGIVPASRHPSGFATPVPEDGAVAIETLLDAVERNLTLDLLQPVPEGAPTPVVLLTGMLTGIEAMGLLSAGTKAAIMARTTKLQSWAESKEIGFVTARMVGLARGDE
jgi:hypothetical protein